METLCERSTRTTGRPAAAGRYFRFLLLGYFEGLDSERGIAWRAADSLRCGVSRAGVARSAAGPLDDSRTRRLIDWKRTRTSSPGCCSGWPTRAWSRARRSASTRRRWRPTPRCAASCGGTRESYQEFLTRLAKASGIETPTREDLARLDRKRKKKGSNDDWTHPHDPDAKITKMKDGRTHLAHKAEHAVDLETGAIVGVTVQDADDGRHHDEHRDADRPRPSRSRPCGPSGDGIGEIVGDKGYHSNQTIVDLEAVGMRTYIAEPDRGRRNWTKKRDARDAVYGNRRRIRGTRGQRLLRQRGERMERPFAHLYETGGMRRVHLRGQRTF